MKKRKSEANQTQEKTQTLRSYAKRRVLEDMVKLVRKSARFNPDYLIIIFDNHALKVFSSCSNYYELISISKIYHMENLEKVRKRYKSTDVIYFVSPNVNSIKRINDDFPESGINKYGAAHLCFTSQVSDEDLMPLL